MMSGFFSYLSRAASVSILPGQLLAALLEPVIALVGVGVPREERGLLDPRVELLRDASSVGSEASPMSP